MIFMICNIPGIEMHATLYRTLLYIYIYITDMICITHMMYNIPGIGMYAGARFVIISRDENPSCVFKPTDAGCFSGGQVKYTHAHTQGNAYARIHKHTSGTEGGGEGGRKGAHTHARTHARAPSHRRSW
jgi:hypothetical protein